MNGQTRREFLGWALPGALAAGTSLTVLQPFRSLAEPQQPPPPALNRGYVAGKSAIELDGQFAGWIESAGRGQATSVVAPSKVGPGGITTKQVASVGYEDITATCGTGMSKNFYDWIKASFDKHFVRRNCAIITCDYNYKVKSRMDLFNAILSEVSFPACDEASRNAANMTVKFAPVGTRMTVTQAGATYQSGAVASKGLQKKWLPTNFRLQIAGLEADCQRANKIGAIGVRIVPAANKSASLSPTSDVPLRMQPSNLAVTIPEMYSGEFHNWYQDFVIRGNNSTANRKVGTLEYLTPDLRESLFTLTFRGLGISELTPEILARGDEAVRQVRAAMYCEDIGFAFSTAA
jgi:hypothetical protein